MLLLTCILVCSNILHNFKAIASTVPVLHSINGAQIEQFNPHWTIEENQIDFTQLFALDDIFPIEINVPDAIMSAWQGIESAWTAASDYFSMNEGELMQSTIFFK